MKKCGLLMPVFSLPSKYGIGSFGKWAYAFVDFLKKSGHSYWQILPLTQTGYADSPYASCCDASGNPYFIDLEILRSKKLLTYREVECAIDKSEYIDYGKLYVERYPLLRKAFSRFDVNDKNFKAFLQKGEFYDYALFMAIKGKYNDVWMNWPDELKTRNQVALQKFADENAEEILFWQFLQFEFRNQYFELKQYANQKGISIVGDLPLYVSLDSVDVWVAPDEFLLDATYHPTIVSGCPPDYFSTTGQLWGNPIYNYEHMKQNGFSFWKERVQRARKFYDVIRIDHFRGLDRFWAIPYGDSTAERGWWVNAPGREILDAIGTDGIIAEDLGIIDESAKSLIEYSKADGMKVLQFAFDGDEENPYLPWNITSNSVVYTGTHDNDTTLGLLKSQDKETIERWKVLIKKSTDYVKVFKPMRGIYNIAEAILDIAYGSEARLCIVPVQDVLYLDSEYRINNPGTIGWWRVKIKESVFTDTLSASLKRRAKRFGRN